MNFFFRVKKIFGRHAPVLGFAEVLRYIGPGFLVTVGFIDPGNWASNIAAGSRYGYSLLWVVTLSTIMLVILQHNAAHLGIVTGLCLSEASSIFFPKLIGTFLLSTAMIASVSTALAEILGAAIGLNMLFGLQIPIGAVLSSLLVCYMLLSNSYRKIEKWIIGFVALIGLSFLFELSLVKIGWNGALKSCFTPSIPSGSLPIVMSVLGAVVMPHNLFLHSEVIQSRQWNIRGEEIIKNQLKFEFTDTLFAMLTGWAINCAMLLVAAAVFYPKGVVVTELPQAQLTLRPLLGNASALVFAFALLLAGISSSVTAGIAGGSIFAGIFQEPYNISDSHSRVGIVITLAGALFVIFFLKDPFQGIIWSQIALSIQLPLTIFALVFLTSSQRVMGKFTNSAWDKIMLWCITAVVSFLNIMLLI
jgi:manganese transport protein